MKTPGEEAAYNKEAPAVEVQPPPAPGAYPPRCRRLVLILSELAIVHVTGVSQGLSAPHPRSPGACADHPGTPNAHGHQHACPALECGGEPRIGKVSTWVSQVGDLSPNDAWVRGTDILPGQPALLSLIVVLTLPLSLIPT
jgi:hypothetical protein